VIPGLRASLRCFPAVVRAFKGPLGAVSHAWLACSLLAAAVGLLPIVAAPLPAPLLDLDSVRLGVMEPNGIDARDLDLFPASAKPDPYRLSRVESVLRNPFRLEEVIDEVLARTGSAADGSAPRPLPPDALWPMLDLAPATPPGELPGVPAPLDSAFSRLRAGLAGHMADLSPAERGFLFREASSLFLQEEEDTSLTAVEGELKRLREDARAARVLEIAGRLRRAELAKASTAAWGLQARILDSLRSPGTAGFLERLKRLAAREKVPFKFGGMGADSHRPDRGVWIDPGGDDQYDLAPAGRPGEFLLVIDLDGDDLYRGRDSLHRSAGNMGVSLIADLAGDDHYLGSNYAFGSALFGYSHVFDAAGNDYYEGRCASLGFAAFGLGVLQDEAGSDAYSASLLSQGASATWGLGLLLDRAGDDRYLARPTFQDDLRYADRFLNMVQGFSTGLAPDYSGGIGILRDQAGHDVYLADIFGQGSGYWYALGLLLDEAGNDRYEAHQYAQGAGVHIAVGAAVDWAGDDHYASKGVSQGCGHDLAFGLLHDRAGNDNYLGTDKVQGSGSANGLGVHHDAAGDDHYQSINPGMALGDADMRRDRGSFGFFLDGGGRDRYTRRRDGQAWGVYDGETRGNGFGLDRPGSLRLDTAALAAEASPGIREPAVPSEIPPVAAEPGPADGRADRGEAAGSAGGASASGAARPPSAGPAFSWTPPRFSGMDTLFITAATGEPRLKGPRDSAEKALLRAGEATLDYLVANRLTGQTPRQRHYVERLFAALSDSGLNPAPARKLDAALRTAPDSVKPQLLRIGSALGDTAFLPAARRYLRADSLEVRMMALRSLGIYPRPRDQAFLLDGIGALREEERRQRLWALSLHGRVARWSELMPLLSRDGIHNRRYVRRIALAATGGDWEKLARHRPASPDPRSRMEWALLAAEAKGERAKGYLAHALRTLDPLRRLFLAAPPPASSVKNP
jgi:hypothetical protein